MASDEMRSELRRRTGDVARRAGRLAKEHPVAAVAVAAGAVAIVEFELAAAALVGVGVGALVTRRMQGDRRQQLASAVTRGRSWLAAGLGRLQAAVAPPAAPSAAAPPAQPAEPAAV
jgi:hypothetical protein